MLRGARLRHRDGAVLFDVAVLSATTFWSIVVTCGTWCLDQAFDVMLQAWSVNGAEDELVR